MTKHLLPLGATALLLALAGCANQPAATTAQADPIGERLSGVEGIASLARDQGLATQSMIGELNRKVDALSGELAGLREASGAARQARDSAAGLGDRLAKAEQRLAELDGRARSALDQAAELKASQAAQIAQAAQSPAKELVEETDPPVAERLDEAEDTLTALEQRLDELTAKGEEQDAQSAELKAALPALEAKLAAAGSKNDGLDARLAAIEKRLAEVASMAQDALDATGLGQRRILGKVVQSLTLTDDKTLFPINSPDLGEKDMAQLDELAKHLQTLGTNYHLQIQGHTDGFGSEDYNYELGKARAEVVKNYLNEKWKIPLLRMSVISYGALAAPSYAGKSNRRIVVQVLQ